MATHTNASSLASSQRRRYAKVKRSILAATRETAEIARDEARKLTAGTISKAILNRDRPFSRNPLRRRGNHPKLPINKHRGKVYGGWRIFSRGNGFRLQNVERVSKFVLNPGGTRRMIARGFWTALRKIVESKWRKLQREALRKGLEG